MTGSIVLPALSLAAAAALVWPPCRGVRPALGAAGSTTSETVTTSWLVQGRALWAVLAAAGPVVFVGPPWGLVVGGLTGGVCWWWAARDRSSERTTAEVRRDLPGLVLLVGCALESGCSVPEALAVAADARGGPAADAVRLAVQRLRLGVEPHQVWGEAGPGWSPLARALARSARTGAEVSGVVVRLADELADERRGEATDRARRVGVAAALPLGVCLLPSFLLLGIVPMAAGLVSSLLR